MTRHPLRIALILLVVAATALALRFATREDATRPVLTAPASGPTTCRTPSATGPVPAPSAASLAGVRVPGATSIDTRGLLPGPVVESADGSAWAIVGTSNAGAIGGRVARIDAERTTISTVTTVVDGCDASALAAGPDGIWVGTCDARAPAGSTSGAELVRIDPVDGQVRSRVTLPGTCVASVAVAGGSVWATNAATIDAPQRLWRLDVSTGAVDEPVALGADETITGLAATSDAVWTSRRTRAGDRIVRSDARSGADTTSFATGPGRVVGVLDGTLWVLDVRAGALVGRVSSSGTITSTVPAANVQSVGVGPSGVWLQQADRGSLTITLSRISDAAAGASPVVSFTGAGPDRTGLPFLGILSATSRGLWFASQDRLFLLAAPSTAVAR